MISLRRPGVVLAASLVACSQHAQSRPPTTVQGRAYHYADNSGLVVGTYGASVAQPLPGNLTVEAQALADHIVVDSRRVLDPTTESLGKVTADVVTSASATVAMGRVAREWRFEGTAAVTHDASVRGRPARLGGIARVSTEPDYEAFSGALRAGIDLAERNTSLDLSVGVGRDVIEPVAAPPGMEGRWPASHRRLAGTLSLSQVLNPRAVASAGVGATLQRGRLASPYRNAIVNTTLYPEVVPDERDRYTGFVGVSWSAGTNTALHLRQGFYADSWDVKAVIPEVILARELEPGLLLAGRYRFYRQWGASFYSPRYDSRMGVMTGDQRLGAIQDHHAGFDLRWRLGEPRGPGAILLAGYELSLLDYLPIDRRVIAHMFALGVETAF